MRLGPALRNRLAVVENLTLEHDACLIQAAKPQQHARLPVARIAGRR